MEFLDHVQNQVGQFVGDLPSVPVDPTEDHILVELGVAGAPVYSDPFSTLDPEMSHQFARLVKGDAAIPQIFFKVASQHPVDPSETRPVAHQPVE